MNKVKSSLFVVLFSLCALFYGKTFATVSTSQVCYCHNYNNNPETLCFDRANEGHDKHIEDGTDLAGSCPATPQVPEFGLLTGGFAAAAGAGSYLIMKRRAA